MILVGKIDGKRLEERQIKTVKPDHGAISFVAMVVPCPGGSEDHVPFLHVHLLAIDSGKSSGAFDDKTQGKGHMLMRRSRFSRVYQLQSCIQGIRRVWCLLLLHFSLPYM